MRWPFTQWLSSEKRAAIIGPTSPGTPARPNAVISATRLFTSAFNYGNGSSEINLTNIRLTPDVPNTRDSTPFFMAG